MAISVRSTFAVLMTLGLIGCWRMPQRADLKPRIPALPQDPHVQVYFNQSEAAVYTEPYRQQTRFGDDLEQIIVDTIASATSTVDVAVQELRLPKIAAALVEQHQAGVKVRVILENLYNRPWSQVTEGEVSELSEREQNHYGEFLQLVDLNQDGQLSETEINQRDALVMLANAGVPVVDDTADGSKGTGLMHHKFVVVDGNTVIMTSANFTVSDFHGDFTAPDSRGNPNNLVKLDHPGIATFLTEEFNTMWGDGPGKQPDSLFGIHKPYRGVRQFEVGNHSIKIQFAPTSKKLPWENSTNGLIDQTLRGSTQSVDLALFVFSAQTLVNTLENLHQRGLTIRGLIEPDFAYRSYSEGLDMLGIALTNNCRNEAENKPWQNPIATVGIPNLLEGDRLHHKFGVVDNKIVITGSHNWTEAANTTNDEMLFVIENSTVAAHFNREFERLYQQATLGVPQWLLAKIEKETKSCGSPVVSADDSSSPSSQAQTVKININTASLEELETLPGVGPKLAQRILEARQKKPFTSWDDLDQISGVGPKTLEKWRDRITW